MVSEKQTEKELPSGVVERLSTYLNCLMQYKERGYKFISSKEIGMSTGVNPAEVRRDLVKFGTFGKKGLGYPIDEVIDVVQNILGSREKKTIALVGAGNLGTAIANYEGLRKHGFKIKAIFEVDPEKIGEKLNGIKIYSYRKLEEVIKKRGIRIGIIATPSKVAQQVADKLISAGVKIIINYSEVLINVPSGVKVHNSNPAVEILHTLYYLSHSPSGSKV